MTTLALEGEVDSHTAPRVDAAVDAHVDGSAVMVIDLGQVTFVDSAGLRSLIRADRILKGSGGLVLRNVRPAVRRVFDVTGLTGQFGFE